MDEFPRTREMPQIRGFRAPGKEKPAANLGSSIVPAFSSFSKVSRPSETYSNGLHLLMACLPFAISRRAQCAPPALEHRTVEIAIYREKRFLKKSEKRFCKRISLWALGHLAGLHGAILGPTYLRGHACRAGPEGPQRHPEGHSRDTSGPEGPRDSCSRPGGLQISYASWGPYS